METTATTSSGDLGIDIEETLANIFGCHTADVPKLCQISDLAANIRYDLERDDIAAAITDLNITETSLLTNFVEWTSR